MHRSLVVLGASSLICVAAGFVCIYCERVGSLANDVAAFRP